MAFVDFNTPIGKIRALIPDVEQLQDPTDPLTTSFLFDDEMLQAYLDLNNGNIKRAAAQACLVLANSEAMILRVLKTEDLQTDGAKVAAQLRANAQSLRQQADFEDDASGVVFVGGSGCALGELDPVPHPCGAPWERWF